MTLTLQTRRLLAEQFTPDTLRQLASLMEGDTPARKARRSLSDESIDQLATMLVNGHRPTIGWWKRHAA